LLRGSVCHLLIFKVNQRPSIHNTLLSKPFEAKIDISVRSDFQPSKQAIIIGKSKEKRNGKNVCVTSTKSTKKKLF
jgi:hypothetical protein